MNDKKRRGSLFDNLSFGYEGVSPLDVARSLRDRDEKENEVTHATSSYGVHDSGTYFGGTGGDDYAAFLAQDRASELSEMGYGRFGSQGNRSSLFERFSGEINSDLVSEESNEEINISHVEEKTPPSEVKEEPPAVRSPMELVEVKEPTVVEETMAVPESSPVATSEEVKEDAAESASSQPDEELPETIEEDSPRKETEMSNDTSLSAPVETEVVNGPPPSSIYFAPEQLAFYTTDTILPQDLPSPSVQVDPTKYALLMRQLAQDPNKWVIRAGNDGQPILVDRATLISIVDAQNKKKKEISLERDEELQTFFEYDGHRFDGNITSLMKLNSATIVAMFSPESEREVKSIEWTDFDNQVVMLSPLDLLGMNKALVLHAQKLHDRGRRIKRLIDECHDVEEVERISWSMSLPDEVK